MSDDAVDRELSNVVFRVLSRTKETFIRLRVRVVE